MNETRHRLLRGLRRALICAVPLLAFSLSSCHGFHYALHGYGHTRTHHSGHTRHAVKHHSGHVRVYRAPRCR